MRERIKGINGIIRPGSTAIARAASVADNQRAESVTVDGEETHRHGDFRDSSPIKSEPNSLPE
jgi:hypothetical protein